MLYDRKKPCAFFSSYLAPLCFTRQLSFANTNTHTHIPYIFVIFFRISAVCVQSQLCLRALYITCGSYCYLSLDTVRINATNCVPVQFSLALLFFFYSESLLRHGPLCVSFRRISKENVPQPFFLSMEMFFFSLLMKRKQLTDWRQKTIEYLRRARLCYKIERSTYHTAIRI